MGGCLNKAQRQSSRFNSIRETQNNNQQNKLIQPGVNIRKNPVTGKLQGVPKQWSNRQDIPFQIDYTKVVNTSSLPPQIRPQHNLPKQIEDFIIKSKIQAQNMQKRLKQRKKYQQRQIIQAAEHFGIKSFVKNSISVQSLSSISSIEPEIPERNSFLDVITNYGKDIYQSKNQRDLLTSVDFQKILHKVAFIEEQPALAYQFQAQLGHGSICKVYKTVSRIDKSHIFAVRIITITDRQILDKVKQEITVMKFCQSPNIVKYHFSYYYEQTLFMFIQYMDFGSLNIFIRYYRKQIPQNIIAYIIRQILKGLDVIHIKKQLHRDLKSDNILVNKDGNIKIADFGYALQLTRDKLTSKDLVGTPAWMAPQLIKKEQYTQTVDIWSLGIILVELCQGQPRYLKYKPLIAMILIASKPPQTVVGRSNQLRSFLSRCLKKDPSQRASARQLLVDPFILNIGTGQQQKQTFKQMLNKIPLKRGT